MVILRTLIQKENWGEIKGRYLFLDLKNLIFTNVRTTAQC